MHCQRLSDFLLREWLSITLASSFSRTSFQSQFNRMDAERVALSKRMCMAVWPIALQYAKWEEGQGDLARARSVWERALDVDYHNVSVWCVSIQIM